MHYRRCVFSSSLSSLTLGWCGVSALIIFQHFPLTLTDHHQPKEKITTNVSQRIPMWPRGEKRWGKNASLCGLDRKCKEVLWASEKWHLRCHFFTVATYTTITGHFDVLHFLKEIVETCWCVSLYRFLTAKQFVCISRVVVLPIRPCWFFKLFFEIYSHPFLMRSSPFFCFSRSSFVFIGSLFVSYAGTDILHFSAIHICLLGKCRLHGFPTLERFISVEMCHIKAFVWRRTMFHQGKTRIPSSSTLKWWKCGICAIT